MPKRVVVAFAYACLHIICLIAYHYHLLASFAWIILSEEMHLCVYPELHHSACISNCIILHEKKKKCITTMFVWNLHSFLVWILKLHHAFCIIHLAFRIIYYISHMSSSSCMNLKISSCMNPKLHLAWISNYILHESQIASCMNPELAFCMNPKLHLACVPEYILCDSQITTTELRTTNSPKTSRVDTLHQIS